MKIVLPSAELVWITPGALEIIERAGRTAYKSEDKITEGSAVRFVKMILERGHDSVIEHASASIKFICDRGVSHELVRHRLFSFTQESTRYCNYSLDRFERCIQVIRPAGLGHDEQAEWLRTVDYCEKTYFYLLQHDVSPQIARSVLPNCLKTEIVVTGNFREWRHFFKLRTTKAAHPQMQEIAVMAQDRLHAHVPEIF